MPIVGIFKLAVIKFAVFGDIHSNTIEEGLIISTKNQKKGRGQRDNIWESEKGMNLMMSLCLQPNFLDFHNVFYLTIITSLSLIETLIKRNIEASIKWPNDIYVDDKKIAGVLIENVLKAPNSMNTIIGVGINVNQKKFNEDNAVSLIQLTKEELSLSDMLYDFVRSIDKYYLLLHNGERKVLWDLYHRYLYKKDIPSFFDDGNVFEGVIQGVNQSGQLSILKDNLICDYNLKEIKFL